MHGPQAPLNTRAAGAWASRYEESDKAEERELKIQCEREAAPACTTALLSLTNDLPQKPLRAARSHLPQADATVHSQSSITRSMTSIIATLMTITHLLHFCRLELAA